jgi:predicted DNA-binding ribbon-helix-helix protein
VLGGSARSTISNRGSRAVGVTASGMRHSAPAATAEKPWPSGKSATGLEIRVFVACYLHDHPSPPTRPLRSVTIQAGWHSQGRSIKAHRIAIHGHQTSLRLEPEYWFWLRQIAAECGMTAKTFIESINIAKDPSRPLSSVLRCSIAAYFHGNPYPIYRVDGHGCIARLFLERGA